MTTVAAFAFQDNVIAAGNVTAARHRDAGRHHRAVPVPVRRQRAGRAARRSSPSATRSPTAPTPQTNLNHRWPDLLAARLRAARLRPRRGQPRASPATGCCTTRTRRPATPPRRSPHYFGQSALRRFDRDVLAQPGREYLVVLLGVNDLGHPGTVAPAVRGGLGARTSSSGTAS